MERNEGCFRLIAGLIHLFVEQHSGLFSVPAPLICANKPAGFFIAHTQQHNLYAVTFLHLANILPYRRLAFVTTAEADEAQTQGSQGTHDHGAWFWNHSKIAVVI